MKGLGCNLHVTLQLLPPLFSALPIQRVQQPIPAPPTTNLLESLMLWGCLTEACLFLQALEYPQDQTFLTSVITRYVMHSRSTHSRSRQMGPWKSG